MGNKNTGEIKAPSGINIPYALFLAASAAFYF
jgi:hypothetical protein